MRKYTILFVITKLELGGAQRQLLSFIRTLNQDKYKPILLTAREGLLLPEAFDIAGLSVIQSPWLQRPVHPVKDLLALFEIFRVSRRQCVDIIHTHSSKAGILGRLAGRLAGVSVIIHTVHGWGFNDYQPRLVRGLFMWLERIAACVTDKLIVVSAYDREKGLRCGIGRRHHYALIPYGIDHRQFSAQHASGVRDALGIKENELVVTMVACLKPQKAIGDFVAAASSVSGKFPSARFLVAGDGDLRPEVSALIRKNKLDDCFTLLGWRRDIPEILAASDVIVLTSLWEGMPIAVLEASAAGRPIVATHTGGVAEVVRDGSSGFLVEPHDIEGIAHQIGVLLSDPKLRQGFGEKARQRVAGRFTVEHMREDTHALYAFCIQLKMQRHPSDN
jgi:glycosyltransferase involved in cell wall biosynthesis